MRKLEKIKNNELEVKFFSELVHNYHKLAIMRVMQILREKWNLNSNETQELIYSIIGRMVNESAYALCGAMQGTGMRIEEILPPMTIQILKESLLHGNVVDPQQRKDINTDIKMFKDFLINLNEKNDLSAP